MSLEIKIPSPGESISEVELASWFVEDGAVVSRDQEIGEIESEKATLPLIAEEGGKISLLVEEGATVKVGDVVCRIDTSVKPEAGKEETRESAETQEKGTAEADKKDQDQGKPKKEEQHKPKESEAAERDESSGRESGEADSQPVPEEKKDASRVKITPVAREMMESEKISLDDILQGLKKITSKDVQHVIENNGRSGYQAPSGPPSREEKRVSVSQLRKKISQRLVAVKNETAMLTTFNEADMSAVIAARKKYQERFIEKHGIKVGFMSFFTRAVTIALRQFPAVNSFLDGDEIVTPEYCDIGIAVQTDKGLMVPVLRNTEAKSLAEIEKSIADLAGKARKARLSIDEMSGGTFTITNGGIFGSMLSTPILNPPQAGILGMHNIIERPVAIRGKVEIRPMMYLALSYDHRIIDGRDSVSFLKTVKDLIEDPVQLVLGGGDPFDRLLDL